MKRIFVFGLMVVAGCTSSRQNQTENVKPKADTVATQDKKAPGNIGYVRAISRADAHFDKKEFEQAKKAYTEALDFDNGNKYAIDKIAECDKLLKQQK